MERLPLPPKKRADPYKWIALSLAEFRQVAATIASRRRAPLRPPFHGTSPIRMHASESNARTLSADKVFGRIDLSSSEPAQAVAGSSQRERRVFGASPKAMIMSLRALIQTKRGLASSGALIERTPLISRQRMPAHPDGSKGRLLMPTSILEPLQNDKICIGW